MGESMKTVLLLASLIFATCFANANPIQIQAIPGKVKLIVDINLQGPADKLDVLFVIDDSGSMSTYQKQVAGHAIRFMDELSAGGTNWRLALVSSTPSRPPVGMSGADEISSTAPNSYTRFVDAVMNLGTSGNSTERPFDSIATALRANPGFIRRDAKLVIVLITDAPDQSALSADDLATLFTVTKGDLNSVAIHAFINPKEWCAPSDDSFSYAGSKYEILLAKVQGRAYPICNASFGTEFTNLGAELGKVTTKPGSMKPALSRIPLPSAPVLSSIDVRYGSDWIVPGSTLYGWILDDAKNEVVLGEQIPWTIQPAGTMLEITYVPLSWK